MGELTSGQNVGNWKSNFGQADITVKREIGQGFASQEAAAKAAFDVQAVITHESDGRYHAYQIDDGAHLDDLELGEAVTLKKGIPNVNVLDVVGRDHYQVKAERQVFPPIGPDTGKVVYFMRNLTEWSDSTFLERVNNSLYGGLSSEDRWTEEIAQARRKGYTVILDHAASRSEMLEAFYDPRAAGLIFYGHGSDGSAVVEDGGKPYWLSPKDIDPERVSPHLRFVSWQSCSTNTAEADWERVLGGADSVGYKRTVTALENAAANDPVLMSFVSPTLSMATTLGGKNTDYLIDKYL